MTEATDAPIGVIGAGIVGLCCARALQLRGFQVIVVDPDEPGTGTSYGNAGLISSGSVVPEGKPGLWRKVPGMLADPLGPLAIRWSYLPQIAPFLLRMMRASTPQRFEAIATALAAIVKPALEAHRDLIDDTALRDDLLRRVGTLYLFENEAARQAAAGDIALRRRHGIAFEELSSDEVRQLVPALTPNIAGGAIAPDSGHTINPLRLSQTLAEAIGRAGGTFRRARVQDIEIQDRKPAALQADGARIPVSGVVIAAGAYSAELCRRLGSPVPLDTERGYHVMLPDPGLDVRVPMLIGALGMAVTPMEEGLRLAGTVEFAGLHAPPNYRRADVLLQHGKRLFPGLNDAGRERWMGRRPSLPDSLPVISASPKLDGVYFAFGHGHLGLTLAAVTGDMIAAMASGAAHPIDPSPYRVDRF